MTPYDAFLESTDLDTWTACLRDAAVPRDPGALAQALCLAMYVQWLGRVSGHISASEEGLERETELRAALAAGTRGEGPDAYREAWGLVLAWTGYPAQARALLVRDGALAPEHLLLVIRDDTVNALTALRDLATGPRRTAFLPVLEHYGRALVNIGEVHAARRYIEQTGLGTVPLLREVLGQAGERLGQWADAYEAYRGSDWPVHRYRAAMIAAILGREHAETTIDAPTRILLSEGDGDLDDAELTRCSAFLNACLWRPVDDWRVSLELGKLSVRRRRHAEADLHLARALRDAPEPARFPIAQMKFLSLTWLTDEPTHTMLRMRPEAVRDGFAALAAAHETDETATITTWLAGETGELGLIPHELGAWSAYDRGEAYDTLGDPPRAVDAWIESLGERYYHRAVTGLIRAVAPAGMQSTTRHLATLVLRESDQDYLALWETARTLRSFPIDDRETASAEDARTQHEAFLERLIALSRFDFRNTIRTLEFASKAGYEDLAEELLLDATKQADGVSDHLAVAVLRREAEREDDDGLQALARALGEARHRLDRLELASELCRYGSLGDARRILDEEHFLAPDPPFEPIETVVALGCQEVLSAAEARLMLEAGARRLVEENAAGALGPRPSLFAERLLGAVSDGLRPPLAPQLQSALVDVMHDAPSRPEEAWLLLVDKIASEIVDPETEDAWQADLRQLAGTGSLGARVALASRLRSTLGALEHEAERIVPAVGAAPLPVAKDDARGDGLRAIELSDLWRSRLIAPGAAADERLQAFYAEEQRLLEQWEQARAEARRPTLRTIARATLALGELLELPLPTEPAAEVNPVLRALYECVAADFDALAAEAHERHQTALEELSLVLEPR
jgi:hypothetical protein